MVVNDPIADMLTRIRNAQVAKHEAVTLPASNTDPHSPGCAARRGAGL